MEKKILQYAEELVAAFLREADLNAEKRKLAKKYGIAIPTGSEIMKAFREIEVEKKIGGKKSEDLMRSFRKRSIRTMSGVAPVAVLTMPFACPGKCAYCPDEKDVPRSYLSNEPAVMRAIRCDYDPYVQVQDRLRALEANGHHPNKIELIVIGGTWSVLPVEYKYWYIKECFRGANEFSYNAQRATRNDDLAIYNSKPETLDSRVRFSHLSFPASGAREGNPRLSEHDHSQQNVDSLPLRFTSAGNDNRGEDLLREQKKNEKAEYRIIGVTLETRPDHIDEKELLQMRELGCTRVELGVQAIDDVILKKNHRGHGVDRIAEATALLRSFGFKITYHLMPGLPGATPEKDLEMFKILFNDPRFQPDQIKFYPTVVTKGSLLYRWWKAGKYIPYTDEELAWLITECKKIVPEYVRIIRLIRDIPGESIIAGNKITNLRQVMKQRGVKCNCIRCREPHGGDLGIKIPASFAAGEYDLRSIGYDVSGGKEYFLQMVGEDNVLYGFCRLFLYNPLSAKGGGGDLALIRELHVYGELVPVGSEKKVQHSGLGKKLMAEAEGIAREAGFEKMAVISGIGARDYYRKLGYRLSGTYMVKKIKV